MTMRPLWRNMAGSLARIVTVPPGAELWYDDRDIPALQEDQKDAAEIQAINASAISSLITSGYKPDSVVAAVTANDLSRLVHTGLFSVQLQPPGTTQPPPSTNGSVPAKVGANVERNSWNAGVLDELIRWNEARLEQSPPVVNVTVEPAPAPVSYVTVEAPRRPTRKEIDFGDGRTATITERGNTRDIDFGDGRVATVTEHDEEE